MTPLVTRPPEGGVPVALYDGHCRLCTRYGLSLVRRSGGRVVARSFHDPGVLESFPGLTPDECMRELKVVDARGRVRGGAEAVVYVMGRGSPLLRVLLSPYFLPGLRGLIDRLYAWVARNRYRLFGRTEECGDEACAVHGSAPRTRSGP
jgi:predicted DCC family thiol-disulfide oxidoreductase YuxK